MVTGYLLVLRAKATLDAAHARRELAQRLFDQASQLQKKRRRHHYAPTLNCRTKCNRKSMFRRPFTLLPTPWQISSACRPGKKSKPSTGWNITRSRQTMKMHWSRERISNAPSSSPWLRNSGAALFDAKEASEQRLPSVTFQGTYFEQGRVFKNSIPAGNRTTGSGHCIFASPS